MLETVSTVQVDFVFLIPIITALISAGAQAGSQYAAGRKQAAGSRAQLVAFQNQIGAAVGKVGDQIKADAAAGILTLPEIQQGIQQVTDLRNQFYNYALNFGVDGQNGIATIGGIDGATNPGYVNAFINWMEQQQAALIAGQSTGGGVPAVANLINNATGGHGALFVIGAILLIWFSWGKKK